MSKPQSNSDKLNIKVSPLVKGAEAAKNPTGWILATILIIVVGILGIAGIASMLVKGALGNPVDGSITAQLAEAITFGSILLFIFLWIKFKEKRPFRTVGFLGKGGLKRYGLGFGVGLLMMAIPTLTLLLAGQYEQVTRVGTTVGAGAIISVVLLFFVWAIQSTTEEVAMRGYLLQTYGRQVSAWAAVLIPSIIFAVMHLGASPVALINIILVALFFSFLSLGQGSIWMAAGIHTGWNMMQGNILGIPVSNNPYTVSIWTLGPVKDAPTWLTGGNFGIEASVAASVVLGAAAIWSYYYYRSKQSAWEIKKSSQDT